MTVRANSTILKAKTLADLESKISDYQYVHRHDDEVNISGISQAPEDGINWYVVVASYKDDDGWYGD